MIFEAEIITDRILEAEILTPFVQVSSGKYTSEYDVTPNFDEQKLQTKNLIMKNDVTVHAIPVEKVANTSGGNTIIIGG